MTHEEGRRARKRFKNAPSYAEVKAAIDAKEKAAAERKAERKSAKKPLTPAEKYEQEKSARAKKGSSGYGYSQHLMGGSGSSSSFNPRSVREEVLSYLLDEGFASDEKSAEAIMDAMSEAWIESIVESEGDVNPSVNGRPMMVGGKPLSLDKKQFKWTQKMGELRRTDPKKYGEVKSLMGPHGWKQPPAGMKLPNWL